MLDDEFDYDDDAQAPIVESPVKVDFRKGLPSKDEIRRKNYIGD